MSSRQRRANRALLLGARAYAQYLSCFARRVECETLFVAYRVRWLKLVGVYGAPAVGQYYRAYCRYRGIDLGVIFHG